MVTFVVSMVNTIKQKVLMHNYKLLQLIKTKLYKVKLKLNSKK